ncbi:MAG: hypothetical protein ACYC63_17310 [Armatimonadota bacterium]
MCHRLPQQLSVQQQFAQQTREQELEARASELLRAHAQCDVTREYPFYKSDSSLRQASARDGNLRSREFLGASCDNDVWAPVLQALCDQIELTETNRALLELMRQGHRAAEIARALNLTPKAVRRRRDRIIARLRFAARNCGGRNRLLLEAYEEQLEQHRYQPEQHCAPGREACRRDGKCRFRWYLYSIVAEQTE